MLTCKVGEKIINTFEYTDEQIRKWSNKGILKCPVCDSQMVFRNGEIKIAHFAHCKDSDCEDIFSEPETEEHLSSKKMLYEWLIKQEGISNLKLEAWIPETKQRPDLYFEIGGERFVIEFQCTPIATEYIQRHRLYELAGIKDLWILGTFKYNIMVTNTGVSHSSRLKEIETHKYMYIDVNTSSIVINKDNIGYKPETITLPIYNKYSIEDVIFDINEKIIKLKEEEIDKIITRDGKVAEILRKEKEIKNENIRKLNIIIDFLNERYKVVKGCHNFSMYIGDSGYYQYSITYESPYNTLVFYIKNKSTDCTEEYSYTSPFRGKRGGLGWRRCTGHSKIASITHEFINADVIKDFIIDSISTFLRKSRYPEYFLKEGLDA